MADCRTADSTDAYCSVSVIKLPPVLDLKVREFLKSR